MGRIRQTIKRMSYQQGDILLIPYPFTDLSDTKLRPVIVVSNSSANRAVGASPTNYIVAKITSRLRQDAFSFLIATTDTDIALPRMSEVRTNELMTLSESLVKLHIATMNPQRLANLVSAIQLHFDP